MESEQNKLTYEINDKEYLLFEQLVTGANEDRLTQKAEELGGIIQGFKDIHPGGITTKAHGIMKILIPTDKLDEWKKATKHRKRCQRSLNVEAGTCLLRLLGREVRTTPKTK
ncbi:hypothetical protein LCGC14_1212970 [marine sediment metagenome]|uniref:Uncharacterized protein n=1 Tax=marine sediment metagenome TaxID=412755 RepID=A0A0F9PI62_9ZZZZ